MSLGYFDVRDDQTVSVGSSTTIACTKFNAADVIAAPPCRKGSIYDEFMAHRINPTTPQLVSNLYNRLLNVKNKNFILYGRILYFFHLPRKIDVMYFHFFFV